MHQCRHITLPIVRCLPLHRVVQLLQTSLYTLIVIVATDERVVERVLGGGGGGVSSLLWEVEEMVNYVESREVVL